jgi:hypothetical protein
MAASRASRGSASSKPSIIGVLAERHARHLAERAQTLQDDRKPMHTDPSTIWVIDIREQRKNDTGGDGVSGDIQRHCGVSIDTIDG